MTHISLELELYCAVKWYTNEQEKNTSTVSLNQLLT